MSQLVFFTTMLDELISDERRAEIELDQQREAASERERGAPPPPPGFESLDECLQRWREALDRPCQTRITGSRAEMNAELARIRAFCPLEWSSFEGPSLAVILEPRPGDAPLDRAVLSDALRALGYHDDPGKDEWRFDPPLGATDGCIFGRVGVGGVDLFVSLNADCSPAQREIADMLLRSAASLEASLGLRARSLMLPGAELENIRRGAEQTLELLGRDQYYREGALVADVDEAKLAAFADERVDMRSRDLRVAGRTLTLRLSPVSGPGAIWTVCAVFAALVALLWPWAALGALGFALLAVSAHRDKRPAMDVELGLTELRVSVGGATQRFRLPIDRVRASGDAPIADADGKVVPMPLYYRPSGYAPEDVRALYNAVELRSALAKRPLPIAARIALETLSAWDVTHPRWCRERRAGYVAVAITEKCAEVIEDQESLDAWRASAASADAHRIGFVWMRDDSGKGATVGYPSEVEWHDSLRLHPRARVYYGGEDDE